jgi:hypothetical protein
MPTRRRKVWKPRTTRKWKSKKTYRKSPEAAWRKAVLQRCNYTCDITGTVSTRLQAHHLNSWAAYPNERLNPDNGIALTRREHFLFHNWMGGIDKPCTQRDYEIYRSIRLQEIKRLK